MTTELSNRLVPFSGGRFQLTDLINPGKIDIHQFAKYGRCHLIDQRTPITSMGSCFARNIATFLRKAKYNYLITEPHNCLHASCGWNRVYNSASMRQIFEYSLGNFNPVQRWWRHPDKRAIDPFREYSYYDWESKEIDFQKHVSASRKALTTAKVVILTLGLTETWRDSRDHSTFSLMPPVSIGLYDPKIHEFHIQTVDEVLGDLNRCRELLKEHNPSAQIILSVSPVPLHATFRRNVNTWVANGLSKCTLRTAAEYFCQSYNNTTYFESYDIITQAIKDPFTDDNRHVKPHVISAMMKIFLRKYRIKGATSL